MANNENLIPIPGRLHSVATEGHVSGADEIYDDTQQKDQATINSELISAVGTGGSVDSKIATAKAEIIGDAATDYDTLGKLEDKIQAEATRAEAAEEALDGRVDTLEDNWQGVDSEPTSGSSNLVQSGGVYTAVYGDYYEDAEVLSAPTPGGQTIIENFPVTSGHIYEIYVKAEGNLGNDIGQHVGLGSNGYVSVTSQQLIDGFKWRKTATTTASVSRVYMNYIQNSNIKVYAKIIDVSEPKVFSKHPQPVQQKKLKLNGIKWIDGTGYSPIEWSPNSKTIGTESLFVTSNYSKEGYLYFGGLQTTGGNNIYINVAFFDSNKSFVGRSNYSPVDAVRCVYPYFSLSLGLASSGGSDIGGHQADYELQNAYIYQNIIEDDKVYFNEFPFKNGKGLSPNNGVYNDNAKTIACLQPFLVSDYSYNENVYFIDEREQNSILWFALSFFDKNGTFIKRVGFYGVLNIKVPANAHLFLLAMGLADATGADVGGSQSDYGLDKVYMYKPVFGTKNQKQLGLCPPTPQEISPLTGLNAEYVGKASIGQGSACYAGKLFIFVNGNSVVYVYDMATMELLQTVSMIENANYHNNVVTFGSTFYDNADDFPLLYAAQEHASEHKCLVYRITGEVGAYSITLVQTITLPTNGVIPTNYQSAFVDGDNDRLVVVGLKNNPYSTTSNNVISYMFYPLPGITDGDVTYTRSDMVCETPAMYDMPTGQGGVIYNGILYEALGVNAPRNIIMYSLDDMRVVGTISLDKYVSAEEPESLFVYNGTLHVIFLSGNIYRIKF